jgi:Heterokaryon incompatibility protein (HET)
MSLSRKTTFSYGPLPRPRESIRLLQLLPGSADQAIRCVLMDNFLSSLPHYSALSYTWDSASGNEEEDCSIELNSKLLPIRKNLHAFLTVLRSPNKTRTLWADAVCIYQDRYRSKCCRKLRFEAQFCAGGWFCAFSVLNRKIYASCLHNGNISVHRFLPSSHNSAFASPCPFFVSI